MHLVEHHADTKRLTSRGNIVHLPQLNCAHQPSVGPTIATAAWHNSSSLLARRLNVDRNLKEQRAGREILQSAPVTVIVPTGSKCNVKCVFCTDRSPGTSYQYKNLSFDSFLRFASPLRKAKSVGLYGWGEPLVNRDYERIFDYVASEFYGIEIYVTTNGILLDDRWATKFLDYEPTRLTISVNAATRQTYRDILKADSFDRVVSNTRNLLELRRQRGRRRPTVTLSFVSIVPNIMELPDFVDLAADLGADHVLVQDFKVLEEGQEIYSLVNSPERARRYYEEGQARASQRGIGLSTFQPVSYFDDHDPTDCFDPWESFRVAENGDVYPCCYSGHVMGNVLQQSVEEIWNGAEYRDYRRRVNTSDPPVECQRCTKKAKATTLVSHRWRREQ